MEEKVGDGLPNAQTRNYAARDKSKADGKLLVSSQFTKKNLEKSLEKKDAGARQNEDFDRGGNKSAPIEANTRRAEPSAHK